MEKDDPPKVDSFVWTDNSSCCDDDDRKQNRKSSSSSSSSWRIDSIRSSKIYDSDPHSLKEPNSHVAWKNELKLTRFANQELPEALWGSNCLILTHLNTGVQISFCALEALRIWTLMDDEPIIPHLSGRIPDAWDYTYTTNYSGSIEKTTTTTTVESAASAVAALAAMASTVAAKQPNGTTQYAIRTSTTATTTTGPIMPLVELRPPMCKCIGGRMICAGVAKSITTTMKTTTKLKIQQQVPQLLSSTTPPKPSPKWIPCDEDDGPFDMEGLLNAQRLPPLYYTNQIPLWNQNLDPHSYSFLTVTSLVCSDNNNNDKKLGSGFIAILLRCFVRVNGVRVRLIDTKYIIRKRKQKRRRRRDTDDDRIDYDDNDNSIDDDFETATVILREQSWKEGSWNEFLTGNKDLSKKTNNNDYDDNKDAIKLINLGTDLEQGRPTPIPRRTTMISEWILRNESGDCVITRCSSASGVVISVVDSNRIMVFDYQSGKLRWERKQISPEYCDALLSVAVQQSLKDKNGEDCDVNLQQQQQRIVVGDDKGGVHIIRCSPTGDTQSFFFSANVDRNKNSSSKNNMVSREKVQRSSGWVEKATWSEDGRYFAAAAGKKVMINGEIVQMEGTVYDLTFLRSNNTNKKDHHQLLAVAVYAIGGTILLVIDRYSKLGEAPVICSCWPPITGKLKRSDKFKSFAWTTKNILVASTEHFVHVFDVLEVVDTVPKRCYPIESIPIEKKDGYLVTDIEGEFLVWKGSKIRKIKVS
ncbi:hypothetical protein FRACYDRAFT_238668 [Fragilariopsis cylindrus CCMP1102]|uniref:WD40 repeat-like protein n=1 Tax=Fragilariopsis cylindrus CCMP1102 TaxID=635003 RepID=A0A1E7FD59_9STRA|nr:hypothetical protein FRACYDRAFT_238668 [Fragilariopsis cylindrus CCMP1102]|eukprot:OEU16081.1 hypothetical protein FRACYDRAFT_238668 [Fragilariopsis cylindrus CCMP1102]